MERNKGFTLLELLLVISILGILVALLLPRFEDVRTNSNTKVCVANLRGLASVMTVYETAKNASVTWSAATITYPSALLRWQYLSMEPYCPYAPGSASTNTDRYLLYESSGDLPDRGICQYSDSTGLSDHKWP